MLNLYTENVINKMILIRYWQHLINEKLNQDFNSLCDWFLDNKLSIHFGEDKTKLSSLALKI